MSPIPYTTARFSPATTVTPMSEGSIRLMATNPAYTVQ